MMGLALVLFVVLFSKVNIIRAVIMPPRFTSSRPDPPLEVSNFSASYSYSDTDEPSYLLSINEGDAVEMRVHSKANITVNLNRAVSEDVIISVKIYAGPNLIKFDLEEANLTLAALKNDTTEMFITYKANTFGDRVVNFHSTDEAGHAEIVCSIHQQPKNAKIDDSSAYISINIGRSKTLGIVVGVIGWIYFVAWSLSFYFQVVLNYQRKSVVGLNFDFLALNLLGFTCYSIYNFTFLFSREVQKNYYERNTYGRIPVEYNDLFFAVHAFVLTLITVIQCFVYEVSNTSLHIFQLHKLLDQLTY